MPGGGGEFKPPLRHRCSALVRPFWLACWSDFHFDWFDHPSWPDPAGISSTFRWDRSRTHSPETPHTLGRHKPAETPPRGFRQVIENGSAGLAPPSPWIVISCYRLGRVRCRASSCSARSRQGRSESLG